jgi:hypothetical protein
MNSVRNNILTDFKYIFIYKELVKNKQKIRMEKAHVSFCTICGDDCICVNSYQKPFEYNCINANKMIKFSKYCNKKFTPFQ